ncbi:MAG: aromatic amino acid transaminase [Pseudomonadota bacterium]
MIKNFIGYQEDLTESTFTRAAQDTRPTKINLSIGVFRDEAGNAPILSCVQQAEAHLINHRRTKGYLNPAGNMAYCGAIEGLILGHGHPALSDDLIRSFQTPGAGAGLRVAAELIKSLTPAAKIWFSTPVWRHQVHFFSKAGLETAYYDYLRSDRLRIDFAAMLESLERATPGDIVVIHGSCHNPTGADLSPDEWETLVAFLGERNLIPLVDIAYQGFGDSVEEDALGARLVMETLPESMVVVSSSKSFAIYRDRAGALMVKHPQGADAADRYADHICDLIRALYFMPPDHGAETIEYILREPALRALWRQELEAMRQSIITSRSQTHAALQRAMPNADLSYLKAGKGMFSCLPITETKRLALEQEHAIYLMPGGRINFAAVAPDKIERLCETLPKYLNF